MNLLNKLAEHAVTNPNQVALTGFDISLDYRALQKEIIECAKYLKERGFQLIGLDADNTPGWIVADLAALKAGVCIVPLAPFFSSEQIQNSIQQSGIEAIITDNPDRLYATSADLFSSSRETFRLAGKSFTLCTTSVNAKKLPQDVVKISYTSGTTGEAKGVMLRWEQIQSVIDSLSVTVQASSQDRHLSLLPLAVLLENLAGVYVSLCAGANTILPGLRAVGLIGAVGMNISTTFKAIEAYRPSTLIMMPQMLQSVTEALQSNQFTIDSLRFIALGGAPISTMLLDKAESLNLPVYEGYGLTECASVVTLNTPTEHRKGSVGKPLPHIDLSISETGEVLVKNHVFSGYLRQTGETGQLTWLTGDLGYLDDDGYLFLTGRKRNIFITSMGRNVSPEWVERELVTAPEIIQVAVFGEARPSNTAVIVPKNGCDESQIVKAISVINKKLPDYARVSHCVIASEPFTPLNNQLSGTGRNRRGAIYRAYEAQIENCYFQENFYD